MMKPLMALLLTKCRTQLASQHTKLCEKTKTDKTKAFLVVMLVSGKALAGINYAITRTEASRALSMTYTCPDQATFHYVISNAGESVRVAK